MRVLSPESTIFSTKSVSHDIKVLRVVPAGSEGGTTTKVGCAVGTVAEDAGSDVVA